MKREKADGRDPTGEFYCVRFKKIDTSHGPFNTTRFVLQGSGDQSVNLPNGLADTKSAVGAVHHHNVDHASDVAPQLLDESGTNVAIPVCLRHVHRGARS